MNRYALRTALAIVPLASLASLASHAASLPGSTGAAIATPSFVDVDEAWRRATEERPLDSALIEFASTHMAPASQGGGSGGGSGFIDLESPPPENPNSGPPASVHLLPVVGLAPEVARDLHRRIALLELLIGALGSYREPAGAPAERSEEIRQLGTAAHLELFVGHSLAYLEGQTREEKCLSYHRADDHARHLGFGVDAGAGVAVRRGWEPLLEQARTFYTGAFATAIPANLCSLRKAMRKGEVEAALRAAVDARIRTRVEAEIDATSRSLAEKERQYAAVLNTSAMEVPTRELFQLKRAVEDTASLYEFVDGDKLGFERVPATTPPGQPLLSRLRAKRGELDRIRREASASGIDAASAASRATLARHEALLRAVVEQLRAIALTPGLDGAAEERLGVCRSLPDALTAENFMSYAASIDSCLAEAAAAYAALKRSGGGGDPSRVAFVEKLSALSNAYVGYINGH